MNLVGRLLVSLSAAACLSAAAAPVQAPPPVDVASAVEGYASAHGFAGVVRVERRGELRYEHAFGLADRAQHVAATPGTRYRIASITKLFTSTLVLQLAQEGRLDLDRPVRTWLPELPADGAGGATVHQLLDHTSGIAPFDTVSSFQDAFDNGMPQYQRPLTRPALLALCCSAPRVRRPGTGFAYNNADYIVLGALVERVTGQSFEAALAERVLVPAGLHATGMLHWDAIVDGLAPTYFRRPDTGTLVSDMPVYFDNWFAAGGMVSDAADLARFADALFDGRLLKPAMLQAMLSPGLDDYGFGLWCYTVRRGGHDWKVAKRPGSIMGANAVLYRLLDTGETIVILANTNLVDQDEFAQAIADVLLKGR